MEQIVRFEQKVITQQHPAKVDFMNYLLNKKKYYKRNWETYEV